MKVDELLKLKPSMTTIKKMDFFLLTHDSNTLDYALVVCRLATVLFELHDIGYSFKILNTYLGLTNENKYKALAYDKIIELNYLLDKPENIIDYIEKKKEFVDITTYLSDLINYYQYQNDIDKLIKTINRYLSYEVSDESRLENLKLLAKIYLDKRDIYNFEKITNSLISLAYKLDKRSDILLSTYYDAYSKAANDLPDKALSILDSLLESDIDKLLYEHVITLYLHLLVSVKKEYRKATIFEAKHSDEFEHFNYEDANLALDECIKLYEALGSNYNVIIYKNKLQDLMLASKEESKKEEITSVKIKYDFDFISALEPKKEVRQEETLEVVIPNLITEVKKEIKEEPKEKQELKEAKEKKIYKFELDKKQDVIVNLDLIFNELNKTHLNLREYVRLFLTYLNQMIDFSECYLLLNNKQYYFKKERLYSKQNDLAETILNDSFSNYKDIAVKDSKETSYKALLNNHYYHELDKNLSLLAISLKHGSVVFNLNEFFDTNDINYYVLKMALDYLDAKFVSESINNELRDEYQSIDKFINEYAIGIIKQKDNYLHLNNKLAELLNLGKDVYITEYLSLIENKYVAAYGQDHQTYLYKFKNFDFLVEEIRFNIKDSVYKILQKREQENQDDLKIDSNTKLYNNAYLSQYYKDKLKDETYSAALLLIDNIEKYLSLYGLDFGLDIDKAMGIYLRQYTNHKITCFKLENYKYFIIVEDEADRRTIKKILEELLSYLQDKIYTLNHRVSLEFKCSFLRTNMLNINQIDSVIKSLYFALGDETVSVYDKNKCKEKMFESSLVAHICESIDDNSLKVNYYQIVDYEQKSVKYLVSRINLTNYSVEEKTIYDVLEKRKMVSRLERYLLHRGLFELKEIKNTKKYYLPIIFKISEETLLDPTFINYVIEQAKFFDLPLDVVFVAYSGPCSKEVIDVLQKLAVKHVHIITDNLEVLRYIKVKALIYHHNQYKDYLIEALTKYLRENNVDLVIDNILKEEDISKYAVLGIKYYLGTLFDRLLGIKDLLK